MEGLGTSRSFLPVSIAPAKPRPRIADIKRVVCEANGITMQEIDSQSREQRFARPRMVAYALCREMTRASLPAIARQFGGRDHTTILSGARKVAEILERDELLSKAMDSYREQINQIVAERAPPIEPPPPPPRTDARGNVHNFDERPWTEVEIIILRQCWKLGFSSKDIGAEIDRSSAAVRSKAHKLGLGERFAAGDEDSAEAFLLGLSA